MKFLFDFLPFILFFVSYRIWGIYAATAVAMATTVLQIVIAKAMGKTIERMQWVSLALIGVLGGMTLMLQNPIFIMWRSSIVNWLLAAILLVAMLVWKKLFLKSLMGSKVQMPDFAWRAMTWAMSGMFVTMGLINIVVAKNYSESTWVNYKTFGSPLITLVFMVVIMLFLSRHVTVPEELADKNESDKIGADKQ